MVKTPGFPCRRHGFDPLLGNQRSCMPPGVAKKNYLAKLGSGIAAAAKLLQSCPTLCNPIDAAHQAPPSLGFSRQEHWSGLPFLALLTVAKLSPAVMTQTGRNLKGKFLFSKLYLLTPQYIQSEFPGNKWEPFNCQVT